MNMNYREPWKACDDDENKLSQELRHETPKRHILYGLKTQALARRIDCDDVLFEILDGSQQVAVVHLTWTQEFEPSWPATEVYMNIERWEKECMLPEYQEWNAEHPPNENNDGLSYT